MVSVNSIHPPMQLCLKKPCALRISLRQMLEIGACQTKDLVHHLCSVISSGFALEDNPSDMLMVKCPLPPVEQWDEVIRARLLFLLKQGLAPQLFLPASNLSAATESEVSCVRYVPSGACMIAPVNCAVLLTL